MTALPDRPLDHLRELLREVYTPRGVEIWMTSPNSGLDGRSPMDVWSDDDGRERVLNLAEQLGNTG